MIPDARANRAIVLAHQLSINFPVEGSSAQGEGPSGTVFLSLVHTDTVSGRVEFLVEVLYACKRSPVSSTVASTWWSY